MPESGRRVRAVVVDDHPDTAETFARLLQDFQVEATYVTNPYLAVSAVARSRPDIVFLDIRMPGINGYELARLLRRTAPPEDRLKLVAVTAYGETQMAQAAGFDAHLLKPVNIEMILSILHRMFPGSEFRLS